jgi:hypothetical protein
MTSIIDDIGMVVQAMRDTSVKPPAVGAFTNAYDPDSLVAPFFFNGRRKEIVNTVSQKEKLNVPKVFPLIALNGDYQYVRRGRLIDYKLNLLIAVSTTADLSTEGREDKNYIPILYPLYESFLDAFYKIGLFMWDSTQEAIIPPHEPVNRYYYGTNNSDGNIKNMFNEPVDAIELVNFEFTRDITK